MTRVISTLAALSVLSVWSACAWSCAESSMVKTPGTATARRFEFRYTATVRGFPAGAKKARIWVPLPVSDEAQEITNLVVESPIPHTVGGDTVYGNRFACFEAVAPLPAEIPIMLSAHVERREVRSVKHVAGSPPVGRLLEGDRLAPLGGEAKSRADEATAGREGHESKARGIYDRVLADVDYDKSGTGWGQGNLAYVCDVGKGNCSDFHTLFIAMARSESIPAVFEIGFPLPPDENEGTIGGYHCWAWYRDDDGSWKPVDASEADKNPAKTEYFFGTLCENRVAFSRGRDLMLEPAQEAGPVNFLAYPYVEVDGKPGAADVEKSVTFRDL